MAENFAANVGTKYEIISGDNVFDSLFREYERVVFESIITSFGLDFIVKDRHGGDVDTIHNVRQIGKDSLMEYKNKDNEKAYNERGEYNSNDYHGKNPNFRAKKHDTRANAENGVIKDEYTGKDIAFTNSKNAPTDKKANLDHVLSAKNIHDDKGRVLAECDGTELANSSENLKFTNEHLNKSMGADEIPDYIEKHPELSDETKKKMTEAYEKSKKSYETKIAKAYYTNPKFIKDTAKAAGTLGVKMGLRQALGFFFANVWCAIREEFEKAGIKPNLNLDLGEFFKAVGRGVQRGFEETMSIEGLRKLLEGGISGILSSLTTTICNIFFTTAKNVVRIIRRSYSSIVQAAAVLFINPDNYLLGDRMIAVAKIIATGASVVVGGMVSNALEATPLAGIPVIGDIVQSFLGSLVTGVMSCTLLLFLDRSKTAQQLAEFLNHLDIGVDRELAYIKQQAEYFNNYAAKLMEIDVDRFKEETEAYCNITDGLLNCHSDRELNILLRQITEKIGIKPYDGDFDEIMSDNGKPLVIG